MTALSAVLVGGAAALALLIGLVADSILDAQERKLPHERRDQ